MAKGNVADPEFRRERASKAAKASHTPGAEIQRTVTRFANLTPEQIAASANPPSPELLAILRSLLPDDTPEYQPDEDPPPDWIGHTDA